MQDVYAVLKQKEIAIERVHREIEALRLVSHIMESEKNFGMDSIRITLESSIAAEEKTQVVSPAEVGMPASEQICGRLPEAPRKEVRKAMGRAFRRNSDGPH